jgi:hypothetical protein
MSDHVRGKGEIGCSRCNCFHTLAAPETPRALQSLKAIDFSYLRQTTSGAEGMAIAPIFGYSSEQIRLSRQRTVVILWSVTYSGLSSP